MISKALQESLTRLGTLTGELVDAKNNLRQLQSRISNLESSITTVENSIARDGPVGNNVRQRFLKVGQDHWKITKFDDNKINKILIERIEVEEYEH